MLVKVMVGATVVMSLGVVGFQHLLPVPPDPAASCLAKVQKFDAIYTSDRPQSESGPSDLSRVTETAKDACRDGRVEFAESLVARSMMMCRLNNGCGETSRAKGRTSP